MVPLQFFGQNIHFAISLFAALVFFAVFWLEFDAWLAKRAPKELIQWSSFLLIALSFLFSATIIEQSVLGQSFFGSLSETIAFVLRALGYIGIIIAQLLDPLQKIPELKGVQAEEFVDTPAPVASEQPKSASLTPAPLTHAQSVSALPTSESGVQVAVHPHSTPAGHIHKKPAKKPAKRMQAVGFASLPNVAQLLLPLSALAIAALYWRRATTGLERHYKPVAISFGLLFLYETLALTSLWQDSSNPQVAALVAAFGPLWIVQQLVLLAAVIVLGRWVWQYLTRRFLSQLFMIFTSLTLAIFLLTTISFTFLLVSNIQKSSLDNLKTAAAVLGYAIDGKKAETLANTQSIAENPDIARAVSAKDHTALIGLTQSFLRDKKQSSLLITNDSGQVLLRAEDPDRYGDSVSSDTLVRRALIGQPSSSVTSREGVLAPVIYIKSTIPIREPGGRVVGTATASLVADNAFVDGIKRSTGLDSAIYAGSIRSATTFVAPDGVSRWIGVKETSSEVQNTVLKQRRTFQGPIEVQNRGYLAVYAPLKDIDNTVIGMLFIGQPKSNILQAAGRSIELTFAVTALLLILSIIPAYLIAKYLAYQLE
ncbi:MAG TPA: cache domain-containing protein [Candidatus Saccharimonadales bacterium]|jgi:hypothetical protein